MVNSEELYNILEKAGLAIRKYSGRGMYGKECIAAEYNSQSDLAYIIESCDDVDQAAYLFRNAKYDSMGLGSVVYWPYIAFPEDCEEIDDE